MTRCYCGAGSFKTDRVEFNGRELMVAQMAAQRGGLLICSHLGNLDLCRVLSKRVGIKTDGAGPYKTRREIQSFVGAT